MNFNKDKIIYYLSFFYVALTLFMNLYGYFTLPDKIATHFSLTGKATAYTPTPIYLIAIFALILLLSYNSIKREDGQKIKYILVDTLIVIINFVVIITQI